MSDLVSQFLVAFKLIYNEALNILKQPFIYKEMLWILLPLIITLLLMELYFGHYKKEELGWNSAVSNAIVLFFVGMNLTAYLYRKELLVGLIHVSDASIEMATVKTLIAFFILIESVLLLSLDFFHLVAKKFAFGISSSLLLNFVGAMGIIYVYSNLTLSVITIPAMLLIFVALNILFLLIRTIEPKGEDGEEAE